MVVVVVVVVWGGTRGKNEEKWTVKLKSQTSASGEKMGAAASSLAGPDS